MGERSQGFWGSWLSQLYPLVELTTTLLPSSPCVLRTNLLNLNDQVDTHNLNDSPGAEYYKPKYSRAKLLKTVKGIGCPELISARAETVGGTTPKEVNPVANDWVKSWSLRIHFLYTNLCGLMYSLDSFKFG